MKRRTPTDEQLLRRTARGDREAFEELYARTSPWLALRLRRRCSDEQLVLEVLQDTFMTAWTAGSYAGSGSAAGWLWTVASRHLVDAFRRRARQSTPPPRELVGDPAASAEEEALAPELDDALARALHELSPELRAVLQATVLDGLSVREASVVLGLPEGTVKTRARRARLLLRGALS